MRLLPDANVLVYETLEDSHHHAKACEIIDSAKEVFIPSLVIHEYVWVMLKLGISPEIVSLKIEEYLEDTRTRYFAEPIDAYQRAVKMLQEDKRSFKEINDYLILAIALREGLVLATYDIKLRKAALRRGVEVTP